MEESRNARNRLTLKIKSLPLMDADQRGSLNLLQNWFIRAHPRKSAVKVFRLRAIPAIPAISAILSECLCHIAQDAFEIGYSLTSSQL